MLSSSLVLLMGAHAVLPVFDRAWLRASGSLKGDLVPQSIYLGKEGMEIPKGQLGETQPSE